MLLPSWHLSLSQSCDRIRILSSDVASFKGGQVRQDLDDPPAACTSS
jgi:hypothetical protein